MTAPAITATSAQSERSALWALLAGNFVIGTGILLPAGMMNDLAPGLGVSIAKGGSLIWAGAIVIGASAPLIAAITSEVDRRLLLTGSLLLYVIGHFLSAFSPNFEMLLAIRVVTTLSAGVFTPQAAATVGVLLPPERRGAGITFIFLGWSTASVLGMPMGSLIGATLGWRTAYAVLAVLSAIAAVGIWWRIPRGLRVQRLSLASWKGVFLNPVLVLVLLVTVACLSGQFALFTYIAPALKDALAASPGTIAGIMAWTGFWGVVGNSLASRVSARLGNATAILFFLVLLTTGLALWPLGHGSLMWLLLASAVWGFGAFAANSLQQARLMAIAPPLASASIALNTSGIYVGQAVGGALGGAMVAAGYLGSLSWAGVAFLLVGIACSITAAQLAKS
jgi:MFS transporter, DHA1 family, inner membrane transport protein